MIEVEREIAEIDEYDGHHDPAWNQICPLSIRKQGSLRM